MDNLHWILLGIGFIIGLWLPYLGGKNNVR